MNNKNKMLKISVGTENCQENINNHGSQPWTHMYLGGQQSLRTLVDTGEDFPKSRLQLCQQQNGTVSKPGKSKENMQNCLKSKCWKCW